MPAPSARITALDPYDVRFPTSRDLAGSDAMNPAPDYSAAYLVLRTDAPDGPDGHGFTFTIGRGNDVRGAAIEALRGHVTGRPVDELCADPGALSRDLTGDSQLRRLGPEKGVMRMAVGAVVNALWDLAAKRAGKPLWRLLAVSGTTEDRVIEYVDHLHEHVTDPVTIRAGHYTAPTTPGFSAAMRPESLARYTYPDGDFWAADLKEHAA